jgi:hypothetical protein
MDEPGKNQLSQPRIIEAQVIWQQRARAGLMGGDLDETVRSLIERFEQRMIV